jgi:hypothetical protein
MNANDVFLKSDSSLDAKIAACNSPEEIRQVTKDHFLGLGVLTRERGADFGNDLIRLPEPSRPAVSAPAAHVAPTCVRVFYRDNDRYEVYGTSDQELDQKEAAIRSAIGGGIR